MIAFFEDIRVLMLSLIPAKSFQMNPGKHHPRLPFPVMVTIRCVMGQAHERLEVCA
jgi:hypothetical protein